MMMTAFPLLAMVWVRGGGGSTIPFPPALFFFFLKVKISSRTPISPFFSGRISPQWLSELRRPATCTFGRVTAVFYMLLREQGVERTLSKSQHKKLTLEKKILPPEFELATFRSSPARYQQAVPALRK